MDGNVAGRADCVGGMTMKIVYTGEMDPRLCKDVLGATI